MKFQVFHVNPGKKLKKKDVNNNLSHFMSVFPIAHTMPRIKCVCKKRGCKVTIFLGKSVS